MDAPILKIKVHASLPLVFSPTGNLDVGDENWRWIHCLTIPIEKLHALKFSNRPFKWIRYAIGCLTGAQGDLCKSKEAINLVDYNAALSDESLSLYYHIPIDERRRLFPADPQVMRTHVTSTGASVCRADFRDDVARRDGGRCVFTNTPSYGCDAVHLIAHSKGDSYIATYTERRSRQPAAGDILNDIDSTQNGLFLNKTTHPALGRDVAFLVTPNFAMNTDDVNVNSLPTEPRCTAHLFEPDYQGFVGNLPLGSPIRIADSLDWPPCILFDLVYASAVFCHFGTQEVVEVLNPIMKMTINRDGVQTAKEAEIQATTDERNAKQRKVQQQTRERNERRGVPNDPNAPDILDLLLCWPLVLLPLDEQQAMLKEAKERAEAEDAVQRKHAEERVDVWRNQMAAL